MTPDGDVAPEPSPRRTGETSRAAILHAARERFAAEGYDRATVRSIAAAASIDPAMVIRYFGSKERLFAEAAEYDLHLPDLAALPRDQVGAALVEHYLREWSHEQALVLRAAVISPRAKEWMNNRMREQVTVAILSRLNPSESPEELARRSGLLATQILGLGICRYIFELPPVADMTIEEAVAAIGPTAQRYLVGELPS